MNIFEEQKRLNKEWGVELSNYWGYVVSREITMRTGAGDFVAPEGVHLIFVDANDKIRGVGIVENNGRLSTTPVYMYSNDKFPLEIKVYLMGFEWKTSGLAGYNLTQPPVSLRFPGIYSRFILNSLETM
jgi:hypothetical protein